MKIALLCDDTLDSTDGVQQYVITLGGWLTSQGHEVHYLTSTSERTDLPNIHTLSKRVSTQFNSNHGGMPLPAPRKHIKALLEHEQFDIIHIQMPYSPLLAGRVIQLAPKSTKIIGTFHIFPQSKLVAAATRALGVVVRRQLPKFSHILSVSKAAQDFAKTAFKIDTQVIPNMVDISRFSVPVSTINNARPIQIVFLGRLVERKGSIYLLQAITELRKKKLHNTFEVIIAGKGPLLSTLQEYVHKHGLADIVSFPGFISEDNKPAFLAHADIAVFPSTGGESFGISLIEAMAATPGPVLAGDNPGYRTVMEGGEAQLVQPTDTAAFADTLARYVDSQEARNAAHLWQLQHVKQYNTPVVASQITAVYKDALQVNTK